MSNSLRTPGGYVEATLGKPACPFLGKNHASHFHISKRRFSKFADLDFPVPDGAIVKRGSGYCSTYSGRRGDCMKTESGLFVEKVGRRNFSVNFIGTGFIDG